MSRMLCYGVSMLLSRIAFVVGLLAAASSTVTAQSQSGEPLTLQAALDRALAANPTIAAARLRKSAPHIDSSRKLIILI